MSIHNLQSATAEELVARLVELARKLHVNDLVVEITPSSRFRIVREGNTAHGILATRHALIGILVCLASVEVSTTAGAFFGVATTATASGIFWKEVLS